MVSPEKIMAGCAVVTLVGGGGGGGTYGATYTNTHEAGDNGGSGIVIIRYIR